MSREADIDDAQELLDVLQTVLDGRRYRTVVSALGVLLTELVAAHPRKDQERVLRVFLEGVRKDVPNARGSMLMIDGATVWH